MAFRAMARESRGHEHVGYRYLRWASEVEPGLMAHEKAAGNESFAAEFESLPVSREPYEGWGETMAYLCRRIARQQRGEPVGRWVPEWERQRRALDRTFLAEDEPLVTELVRAAGMAS